MELNVEVASRFPHSRGLETIREGVNVEGAIRRKPLQYL